jgi:hypothetical protein
MYTRVVHQFPLILLNAGPQQHLTENLLVSFTNLEISSYFIDHVWKTSNEFIIKMRAGDSSMKSFPKFYIIVFLWIILQLPSLNSQTILIKKGTDSFRRVKIVLKPLPLRCQTLVFPPLSLLLSNWRDFSTILFLLSTLLIIIKDEFTWAKHNLMVPWIC